MLRFIEQMSGMQIKSIRDGRVVGVLEEPVINPHRLRIDAFYCSTRLRPVNLAIFTDDIREVGRKDIIINDSENMMEIDGDLVRLQDLLKINFSLIGKKVVTDAGRKVGKVANYALDDKTFIIEKLYATQTGIRSLGKSDLIIGRQQIVEVTDTQIVVREATVKQGSRAKQQLTPI